MRFYKCLAGFGLALSLVACGGGGGSPGLQPSTNVKPVTTTAPTTLNLAVGSRQNFSIIGGRAPYQVASGNTQIVTGGVEGSSFWLGAITAGAATIKITDAVAQSVSIAVTVDNLANLFTTAPITLKMAPSSATRTFTIGGGQSPYTVVSDNSDVATVDGSVGSVLKITPKKAGSANITVSDSTTPTRASVVIGVSVDSLVPLSVSPTTATSFIDMPVTVFLNGGTPPYQVGGYIPSAVRVIQDTTNQSKFLVTPLLESEGLDISFIDSQGVTVVSEVIGIVGTPAFRVSPSAISVSALDDQNIILQVSGATLPINVFSSDVPALQASVVGDVITVSTGSSGTRCPAVENFVDITVVDSTGASGKSTILINDVSESCTSALTVAPTAVTLSAASATAIATITNGGAPFVATSSNVGVATVVVSGRTVTITRIAAGTAIITVFDNTGVTRTIAVTAL